jgi:hypothetical protein
MFDRRPGGLSTTYFRDRKLIDQQKLALLLAKAALTGTSESLSPTAVADAFKIAKSPASGRINPVAVKG